jgi:glycosyltransferase involved in cell wall biosynthesis
MIRIGFPLIGGGNWIGGVNYLSNTLRIVRDFLSTEIEAHVALTPGQAERYGHELSPLVDGRVLVGGVFGSCRSGSSLARSLASKSYGPLMKPFRQAGVDVVFENSAFYGWSPELPCLAWIPDFQHRHLPHLFRRSGYIKRELGFRVQLAAKRTLMLSSNAALDDLRRFYGRGNAQVVRFAVNIDIARAVASASECIGKYALPDAFFYLPNQIWAHKNHGLVVQALQLLKEDGRLARLPPIAVSGHAVDTRNPGHFKGLMDQVATLGLDSHFVYLGVLPYEDVLSLNAACLALLNPSMFEGWSTTIEEAKALSTPLLLSDLPIHREQAPTASFFHVSSPHELAEALWAAAQGQVELRATVDNCLTRQAARLEEHARSLKAAVRAAYAQ